MKNFLSMNDLKKEEIEKILKVAEELKDADTFPKPKSAALLFDRPSTRTRVSFEVSLRQLGMHPIYLDYVFSQLARGEKIEDTGKVLSGYVSLIIARLHKNEMLQRLASNSSVSVINAATDKEHPCQALGDLYTLKMHGLLEKGISIAYVGNPRNNVANSLIAGCEKFGVKMVFIAPKGYHPDPEYAKNAEVHNGFDVKADVVYSNIFDVPEDELKSFLPFQMDLEKLAKLGAKFHMHPLPAFRGVDVSDELLDSDKTLAWEQAQNKITVQKALMQYLMDYKG
ncbi:ornithine carbamoyltransferase [Candidatus Micrarchaeota archaeon]|nr:ornithine carbamoyltransferase [Candidatus Micrarchaeota archaeon]